jgi:hypothetical protein
MLPLRRLSLFLGSVILLAGCTPSAPHAAVPSQASSSSSQSQAAAVPMSVALDQQMVAKDLGISVRYPSTWFDLDCNVSVPVKAEKVAGAIVFSRTKAFDANCKPLPPSQFSLHGVTPRIAVIDAQRVKTKTDLQKFVEKTFKKQCVIAGQEKQGDLTAVSLRSKKPLPKGEMDFKCSWIVDWNTAKGVAYFTRLGSKNGGGVIWPSEKPILITDGKTTFTENSFDFAIPRTIKVLGR